MLQKIKQRKLFTVSCVFLLAAIVLMALPFSTALTFSPSGPPERVVGFYSYFSFKIFGMGRFFPPLTAVSGVIWFILSIWGLFQMRIGVNRRPMSAFGASTLFLSIISIFLFTNYITPLSYVISLTVLTAFVLQIIFFRMETKKKNPPV